MRKSFDSSKSGLFALGYINDQQNYISKLITNTGSTINTNVLDQNINDSYTNQRELCYQYDINGNPILAAYDDKRTYLYAIETGFFEPSGDSKYQDAMIHACFTNDGNGRWQGVQFLTKYKLENFLKSYSFGSFNFRSFSDANNFIIALEGELLPGEIWSLKKNPNLLRPKTEYDVLQSYLHHVLDKLLTDYKENTSNNYDKVVFSTDRKYALFNTGLLNRFAQDICLLGKVYGLKSNGWFRFSNPQIAPGKVDLIRDYSFESHALFPGVTQFFSKLNEIIFDADVEIDLSPDKMNHAIIDGVERGRFPTKYTEMSTRKEYAFLANLLESAIKNSLKIAKRNYKYVVPQYRSAKYGEPSKIQFLMPIYLEHQYGQAPDFALVLNEEIIGNDHYYTPETLLELSWAYNNARVICKPENTWLNPTTIESPVDEKTDQDD